MPLLSLVFDARPEALLARYALLMREKLLIHELVNVISSIGENRVACALAQSVYCLIGKEADTAVTEAIAFAPAEICDAFQRATSHPALVSYVDIIEASKPADETFRELTGDRDPFVAALAVSALASSDPGNIEAMTTALVSRLAAPSLLVDDVLTAVRRGCRSDTIVIMAELLAVDVFAALELGALADIARRSVHLTFYAGDQICRVGERSDSMFVLVRGKTEAWVRGDGDRMVLGRANDGAVFGELGVITGRPRSASIEVASATATVIAIPGDALDELLGRDLHAARGILTVVSGYLLDTLSTAAARRSRASGEPAQAA